MNKLTTTLALLLPLMGCFEVPKAAQQGSPEVKEAFFEGAQVFHIRNCDYVGLYTGSHTLVHAGDCTNPIHNCPCDTIKPQ